MIFIFSHAYVVLGNAAYMLSVSTRAIPALPLKLETNSLRSSQLATYSEACAFNFQF